MRKVYIFVLIIVLSTACLALSSCAGKTAFEDIVITGSDVTDLPEGAYTLRYDLINLEEYAKKHDYSLTVTVADQNHKQVAVENKRIIRVQADFVYYVTVLLSGENGKRTKQHNYTVYAVKNDVAITFSSGDYNNFDDFVRTVPYGGTLTDVPAVPEYTPPPKEGYTRTVSEAVWNREEYVDLTVPITVCPVYTVTDTEKSFVLTYDSGGGTTIAAETYSFYSIPTPPTAPEKEGSVFFGWYADAALKIPFAFAPLRQDITVYARWITPNDCKPDCTPVGYFDFELVEGGYSVKAKDKNDMPAEVVIPNTYDGKPVVSIAAAGFSKCPGMLRITIPDTVESIGVLAFSAKKDATDGSPLSDLERVVFETAHLAVIPQSAFYGCDKLAQIDIPDSVEHIESQAFYGCALLESVNFSSSMLRQISDEAFYGCSSLSSIVLPKTVERLNSLAFYNCASPFSATILSPAAPYLDDEDGCIFGRDAEGGCEKDGVFVYVPAQLTETYRALEPYQGYDIIAVPEP